MSYQKDAELAGQRCKHCDQIATMHPHGGLKGRAACGSFEAPVANKDDTCRTCGHTNNHHESGGRCHNDECINAKMRCALFVPFSASYPTGKGPVVVDDVVNHPKHYTSHPSGVECVTIAEHYGFNIGNAIKYLWRAGLKDDEIQDLKKAKWYLDREIARREAEKKT